MNKINNFLNTLSILTTLFILALCYWARIGLPSYVTSVNYFSLFALASTLFILPDFLCYYFPAGTKWYRTSEFYTVGLILLLAIGGIILSQFTAWTVLFIIPIGITLAFWQIFQFGRDKSFLALPAGILFMLFLVVMLYFQNHHNVLFPERIILGKARGDQLFHSTLSNMFSTLGYPSTALNGTPYAPYHWGFHALVAGLKSWTGLSTLMFINIAYPAIFLPLFVKSFFNFLNRLFIYKGRSSLNILFAISFMIFLYSLPVRGFMNASPMISESFCAGCLFTFLYASVLLSYISDSSRYPNLFLFYSLITILLLSFLKISNGFLCFCGLAYLYLRTKPDIKSLLLVFASGITITAFVYLVVFQPTWVSTTVTLPERIESFWDISVSFFTYFTGVIIAIVVVMKNKSLKKLEEIKSMIRSKEYLDFEILFIINISAVFAGIYASGNGEDVYYFCAFQMFISIPYLIFFAQNYFDRFRSNVSIKASFLYLVVILSFISRPTHIKGLSRIMKDKAELRELTQQQQVMQSFLPELFKLEKESDKKTKCIYIPQSEKWYYESQWYNKMSTPLVVPAVSGIAMIGGISESLLKLNSFDRFLCYYQENGKIPRINNLTEAKNAASRKGYEELIEYKFMDGKLSKQKFNLKTQN